MKKILIILFLISNLSYSQNFYSETLQYLHPEISLQQRIVSPVAVDLYAKVKFKSSFVYVYNYGGISYEYNQSLNSHRGSLFMGWYWDADNGFNLNQDVSLGMTYIGADWNFTPSVDTEVAWYLNNKIEGGFKPTFTFQVIKKYSKKIATRMFLGLTYSFK